VLLEKKPLRHFFIIWAMAFKARLFLKIEKIFWKCFE